jgi:hypothetical protein
MAKLTIDGIGRLMSLRQSDLLLRCATQEWINSMLAAEKLVAQPAALSS